MPGPARYYGPALIAGIAEGTVREVDVEAKARHLLQLLDRLGLLEDAKAGRVAAVDHSASGGQVTMAREEHPIDRAEDRSFLRRTAAETVVLLKNEALLPLVPGSVTRVTLVGPRSEHLGMMGGGSAKVLPHYRLSFAEALRERLGPETQVEHFAGSDDDASIATAADLASHADVAVIVVGTDEHDESESLDRESMDLPGRQDELVRRVLAASRRSVLVVTSGAPVTMGWARDATAVVQSFFGGQEIANSLVDVIVGDAEPGGRLPTTIPVRLEHTPAFGNFPGEGCHVRYGEGLLIGYRWYEARALEVAFPFGHGLSYTTFSIGAPRLSAGTLAQGCRIRVDVTVTNTGSRRGAEVVQCYVAPPRGGVASPGTRFRPKKELKGFGKVWLEAGEVGTVSLELGERAFAYYDPGDEDWAEISRRHPDPVFPRPPADAHRSIPGWYVEPGVYELLIGRSSADIAHHVALVVEGGHAPLGRSVLPD